MRAPGRTPRSIQRYCAKGHLDCRRIETLIDERIAISSDWSQGVATNVVPKVRRKKPQDEMCERIDLSRRSTINDSTVDSLTATPKKLARNHTVSRKMSPWSLQPSRMSQSRSAMAQSSFLLEWLMNRRDTAAP